MIKSFTMWRCQNLDVTFAIDRAGLVGQDGATHHGVFDLSYLRCVPNMIIACPSDENECRQLLFTRLSTRWSGRCSLPTLAMALVLR